MTIKQGRQKETPRFVFVALNAHASRTSTRRIVERIMHATGGLRNAYRLFAVQAADELRKPKLKTYDRQAGRHRDGVSGFAVFGR